jgi:hypothetical protein
MGLVIVALSARFEGYDVLADPLGWLLVYSGATRLPRTVPWSGTVAQLAILAGLVSCALWFPGVVATLSDTDESLLWAADLPQIVFVATLCAALAQAATDAGDRRAGSWLRTACTLAVVTGLAPVVVYTAAPASVVPMLLVALVAVVLAIVLTFAYSSRVWAQPTRPREVDQTIAS